MANLRPRAADIRGNELQFLRAWHWSVLSLKDPAIQTITVEDPDSGSFDDIVIRYLDGRTRYEQAKCSNQASVALNEANLTSKRTAGGRSPLQHFFDTWMNKHGDHATFALVSNRSIDPSDPILSTRDNLTGHLDGPAIGIAGRRSSLGKAAARWQEHLGCDRSELLQFLSELTVETLGTSYIDQVRLEQESAGLDASAQSVDVGTSLIRQWVMRGAGAQTRAGIAEAVQRAALLSTDGLLRLHVYAIDRRSSQHVPNVIVDLQDLYSPDVEPTERRELRDSSWAAEAALPRLKAGVNALDEYGIRHVEVGGSMRLPYWFTLGQLLPETRNWTLSSEQGSEIWVLDEKASTPPRVVVDEVAERAETALAVCLKYDIVDQVREHMGRLGIDSLIAVTAAGGPGQDSLIDAPALMRWTRGLKQLLIERLRSAPKIHVFIAGPQSAALALGHLWNALPPASTYEWIPERNEYVADIHA